MERNGLPFRRPCFRLFFPHHPRRNRKPPSPVGWSTAVLLSFPPQTQCLQETYNDLQDFFMIRNMFPRNI